MSELLPCPFCENTQAKSEMVTYSYWLVRCGGCEAETPSHESEEKACRLWNTRPRERDAAIAQRDIAIEELETARKAFAWMSNTPVPDRLADERERVAAAGFAEWYGGGPDIINSPEIVECFPSNKGTWLRVADAMFSALRDTPAAPETGKTEGGNASV